MRTTWKRQAQDLVPIPLNLYNVARCYEKLGEVEEAIRAYESYVAFSLKDTGEERRLDRAYEAIQRLRKRAGRKRPREHSAPGPGYLTLEANAPGARARIDDGPPLPTPLERHPLPAGAHTVRIKAPGRRLWEETVEIRTGEEVRLEPRLERSLPPPPAATAEGAPATESGAVMVPFALGGLALAGAAGAFVLSELAADEAREAYAAHGRSAATGDAAARLRHYEETESQVLAHQALLGLGVGLAVAGVAAGIWGGLRLMGGAEPSASIGRGPGGVLLRGRF